MATWKELISIEMRIHDETFCDIVSNTLTVNELQRKFDDGFGSPQGEPFTLWTKKRVYFPVCHDGAEWINSVSRHPDGKITAHIGGW